jgi:hypothetical protein
MKFPIRPGKVTCLGLVGIMLVLPSSIWKSPSADAKVRIASSQDPKTPEEIR